MRHHNLLLQAYRQQRDILDAGMLGEPIDAPEPLRMIMTGTAGTGKTVVNNEMVRVVGPEKFQLLAPTGNAACGIGGQVRSNETCPTVYSFVSVHILIRPFLNPNKCSYMSFSALRSCGNVTTRRSISGLLFAPVACVTAKSSNNPAPSPFHRSLLNYVSDYSQRPDDTRQNAEWGGRRRECT